MTMQHGLEARLPYLSHQVTQLAGALPAVFRLGRGRKWLLKEALLQRLENARPRRLQTR